MCICVTRRVSSQDAAVFSLLLHTYIQNSKEGDTLKKATETETYKYKMHLFVGDEKVKSKSIVKEENWLNVVQASIEVSLDLGL